MAPKISMKKTALILAIVTGVFVLVSVGILMYKGQKNIFGDEVAISNLEDITLGRQKPTSKEVIDAVQSELLDTINLNSRQTIIGSDVKDAIIRGDTYNQSYDENTGIYTVSFIVDIESLGQSFAGNYQWEKGTKSLEKIDEWGINIRCLPKEKLIYEDFQCKDMFSVMGGGGEAIIKYLPHSTLNYRIVLDPSQPQPYTLNVTISTTAADERDDANAAINGYKKQILEWIQSIGFDPQDYSINYIYNRASLY